MDASRSCYTLEADQEICELKRDDDGETVSCYLVPTKTEGFEVRSPPDVKTNIKSSSSVEQKMRMLRASQTKDPVGGPPQRYTLTNTMEVDGVVQKGRRFSCTNKG